VVAVARAELRAVKGCKQATATHLPRDGSQRILRGGRTVGCILRLIRYAGAGTAIGITDQHPPELINRNVVEVEQVAAGIAPALVPDAATLYRVCGSGVGSGPGSAAIVSKGDQRVPNTGEISRLSIGSRLCAQEGK